ncbi:hypothetical protein COCC4DRAFT_205889 [Bipolaris maydis ATCC 48331]|uniref:Uncharacterized protein n=2 Tax=Cochliobolus heterostrophus TaxID=5016 RepID=M2TCZ6_COCH5|nr:uncharacterized protein COCC4DRAFT_205889 [Bipolaris maydis ATCC 48331]EMD95345.1 hypothetical protein COCHEDRAFT_1169083 [Bipolaris maydis C5]KAJ5021951.1 hypothetical protein J3E73DRAFT_348894 [Bipolaris maydis]ENI00492.1 hypothetical protein COCC4DRAFT_205889 [Bipolaris maydis ATCC 48331]KAJ5055122.1 hypothetical protein J3E74DRAFT_383670 [Bipolaris maydis]KAJ6191828.1 hypothetical protein J3E72DRAFT_367980 [Bipolaris maydis]
MRQSTTLLSILASTVCAADIISFYFPGGYEGADPVATINTVNPTMTEFRMACPTGVDSSECGWGPGLDATILSQTRYQATMDAAGVSMSLGCDYNKKKVEMTCTVKQEGGNDDTGGEPVTAVFSNDDVKFLTVDVVAGNSLLRTATSTAPSASATTTKTSAQSTSVATLTRSASTGQMTVESVSETASASASATISTASTPSIAPTPTSSQSSASVPESASVTESASVPESTGAAARFSIEGSALLMLAGAAALNVW